MHWLCILHQCRVSLLIYRLCEVGKIMVQIICWEASKVRQWSIKGQLCIAWMGWTVQVPNLSILESSLTNVLRVFELPRLSTCGEIRHTVSGNLGLRLLIAYLLKS